MLLFFTPLWGAKQAKHYLRGAAEKVWAGPSRGHSFQVRVCIYLPTYLPTDIQCQRDLPNRSLSPRRGTQPSAVKRPGVLSAAFGWFHQGRFIAALHIAFLHLKLTARGVRKEF